ncbi:MAG TPA: hypothetical protein GXX24_04500 [Paracoccus solventivorans]|uniref:Glycine-rich domain-containing protein n=1 Tax=Paracoccus solventivorans TaxID=53463 RepID=A0A832QW23_9RHOB|nr:hypothetical protein [Paracoccus solventivorans]HHW33391.1 hypothetical protein [Paracoccus solventivorans]
MSDVPRRITGTMLAPDGQPITNRTLTWYRANRRTLAQGSSVIVDEVFRTATNALGEVDVSVVPGAYLVMVRLADQDRYFEVSVPEGAGPLLMRNLIDTAAPVLTPPLLIEAQDARDAAILAKGQAETARDKAQDWAEKATAPGTAGTKSAKTWAGEAAASAGAALTAKEQAETARDKAQDWAEKATAPGTAGTKSAKTWAGEAAASAGAAATSEVSASGALTSFTQRYLGPKSSPPPVDNDGKPLLVGALYWNTAAGEMRAWDGSAWQASYLPPTGYLQAGNNLSDLSDSEAARTNLAVLSHVAQSLTAPQKAQARANIGAAALARLMSAGTGLTGGGDLTADREISADFATEAEAIAGTATDKVMSPALVAEFFASAGFQRQQFTASGTWIKPDGPADDKIVMVELWGGGGGGGGGDYRAGGGGGGGYMRVYIPAGNLPATVPVLVGAGGAVGAAGGESSFGSFAKAYGGGGAASVSGFGVSLGGGGGGALGRGQNSTGPDAGGAGGLCGGGSGGIGDTAAALNMFGGGGGGKGQNGSNNAGGGWALFGGGGGGGGIGGSNSAPGGISIYGGSGGGGPGGRVAGSAPGGGGSGSGPAVGQTGGVGARGEVRVTIL